MLLSCTIFSCSKGTIVKDPQFGQVSFLSTSAEKIDIVKDGSTKIDADGTALRIVSGNNRFRFFLKDQLLLDTSLSVEPYSLHAYTLFKPNESSTLKVYDATLNGLKTEVLPDSGFVKFSIANFSGSLPGKLNIYISTTTYTPNSDKPIEVGHFLNVNHSFPEFHKILLGINQSSQTTNTFTLTIKDTDNKGVLAIIPLVLPVGSTAGIVGKLTGSVYLLYIDDKNTASILMSK